MSDTKSTAGIGFSQLLTLAFIVLKLTGHISWSWWWVLAPAWIPVVFVLVLLVALGIGYVLK